MDEEKISIIILNYKNYDLTINCVNNLIKHKISYKIVVVDNNSKNNSFEIISDRFKNFNNIFVVSSLKNGGYSYGNNYGIKFIKKLYKNIEYFCIMNPDVEIISGNIFKNICIKLQENSEIALMSCLNIINEKLILKSVAWKRPNMIHLAINNLSWLSKLMRISNTYKEFKVGEDREVAYVDVIPGSFFIIKYNALEEINFLDENLFLYYEENLLSYSLKKKGYKLALNLAEIYLHNHEVKDDTFTNVSKYSKDYLIQIKSQKYYVNKAIKNGKYFWTLLSLSCYFHLLVEIPINCLYKYIRRNLKTRLF